jgi:hypothetical protein
MYSSSKATSLSILQEGSKLAHCTPAAMIPGMANQPTGHDARHVFISYVREDIQKVRRLAYDLKAQGDGIRVWRDTEELWPGQDWKQKIRDAINKGSFVFLACFSTRSMQKPVSYQNEELLLAVEQMRLRLPGASWLIPVRFDDCPIPNFDIGAGRTLNDIQRADLFGKIRRRNLDRLLREIQNISQSALNQGAGSDRIGRSNVIRFETGGPGPKPRHMQPGTDKALATPRSSGIVTEAGGADPSLASEPSLKYLNPQMYELAVYDAVRRTLGEIVEPGVGSSLSAKLERRPNPTPQSTRGYDARVTLANRRPIILDFRLYRHSFGTQVVREIRDMARQEGADAILVVAVKPPQKVLHVAAEDPNTNVVVVRWIDEGDDPGLEKALLGLLG